MAKTIIMLGGGVESVSIIQRAKELDCKTIVVDQNSDAPGREFADYFIAASCYDGSYDLCPITDPS